jgi:hypothetical protein
MLMALQPDVFADLGLIVFDECHLLHPREEDRSRRGLDAMLAILNLSQVAPEADLLLLSAMMKNTAEIAGWLKYLTERECLTLDLAWKPTRQVRGCVVYPAEQIGSLNEMLAKARRDYPNHNNPPAQIQRELGASPLRQHFPRLGARAPARERRPEIKGRGRRTRSSGGRSTG